MHDDRTPALLLRWCRHTHPLARRRSKRHKLRVRTATAADVERTALRETEQRTNRARNQITKPQPTRFLAAEYLRRSRFRHHAANDVDEALQHPLQPVAERIEKEIGKGVLHISRGLLGVGREFLEGLLEDFRHIVGDALRGLEDGVAEVVHLQSVDEFCCAGVQPDIERTEW